MVYQKYIKLVLLLTLICIVSLPANVYGLMLIEKKAESADTTETAVQKKQVSTKNETAPEIQKIREEKIKILERERYQRRPPKKRPFVADRPPEKLNQIRTRSGDKKALNRRPFLDKKTLVAVVTLTILVLIASLLYRSMTKRK